MAPQIMRHGIGLLRTNPPGRRDPILQPKLKISSPGDPFEEEADRIAAKVVNVSADTVSLNTVGANAGYGIGGLNTTARDAPVKPTIASARGEVVQRNCGGCEGGAPCAECEEETQEKGTVHRKPGNPRDATVEDLPDTFAHEIGPGRPLNPDTRNFMEARLGRDFDHVRIHTSAEAAQSARAVDALAYTVGSNLVFAEGQYAPGTLEGRRLIAHELTHVIQQSGGRPQPSGPILQRAMICSKPLEFKLAAMAGARHSYIDDTGRNDCLGAGMAGNYAVTDLKSGNFLRGCAVKTDHSPDPRGKTPAGKPCAPRAGVTDVSKCLAAAFSAYADPSVYSNEAVAAGAAGGAVVGGAGGGFLGGVIGGVGGAIAGAVGGARLASGANGPNSNTFAATLAKACCADATSSGLGWVPGWDHAPATTCSV